MQRQMEEATKQLEESEFSATSGGGVVEVKVSGKKELMDTVCELFERVDFDSVWFCLAVMYSGVVSKKELEREISIREKLLNEYEKGTLENKEKMLQYNVSYIEVCAIDRMIQIIRMEKETLERFKEQSIK